MTSWFSAALPYVGGGVLGAAFTYALTWVRERRRTLDAYRAPQREAIGDIVTATHALMTAELESHTAFTEAIEQVRNDEIPTGPLMAVSAALGKAALNAERALQIGRLTIVDAPCFEAMGLAYIDLSRLRAAMAARSDAPAMQSPEEIEHYVESIHGLAEQFSKSVLALVIAAADRVSPAETIWNRWRRRERRRRIGEHHRQ